MDKLPNILVNIIPHNCQKYSTAGNYGSLNDTWWLEITKMKDWRHSYLVMMHELVEMALTVNENIPWEDIDKFDIEGEGKDHPDPGTLNTAPYYLQHKFATLIEEHLASMLGVDWNEYNKALDELEYKK